MASNDEVGDGHSTVHGNASVLHIFYILMPMAILVESVFDAETEQHAIARALSKVAVPERDATNLFLPNLSCTLM
jgi:hypothetical protein